MSRKWGYSLKEVPSLDHKGDTMGRSTSDSPSALSDRDQLRRRGGLWIVLYIGKWKVFDFRVGRLHGVTK